MRRTLTFLVGALLLFGAALLAGLAVSSRLAPDWVRRQAEIRLGEALGTPVSIDALSLQLRRGLVVEAWELRAWPREQGADLRVGRATGRIDPLALLGARLALEVLEIEDFEVRATFDGSGFVVGGGPGDPRSEPREPRRDLAESWLQALDGLAHRLAPREIPVRHLRLARGRIELAPRPGEAVFLRIDQLEGERSVPRFAGEAWVRLGGKLQSTAGGPGRFALSGRVGGQTGLDLEFEDLDLGLAGPVLGEGRLRGRSSGSVAWKRPSPETHSLQLDLEARNLRLSSGDTAYASPRLDLSALLESRPNRVRVVEARLADADLALFLDGDLSRPLGAGSSTDLRLRSEPFEVDDLRRTTGRLPRRWHLPIHENLTRVEAGRVAEAELRVRTRLGRLPVLFGDGFLDFTPDVKARVRLEGARLAVGEASHLEAVAGLATWDGEELRLSGVEASLDGEPLPRLDARFQGVPSIEAGDEIRCERPPPVRELPGRDVMARWMFGARDPDRPSSWERIAFEADWVLHPSLFCALERARGVFEPIPGGFRFEMERGSWAGMPVSGSLEYHRSDEEGAPSSVTVVAQLGAPWESVGPFPTNGVWAQGRLTALVRKVGTWDVSGIAGGFHLRDATLTLDEATVDFAPSGLMQGEIDIDLDRADTLPYRIRVQLQPSEMLDLSLSAQVRRPALEGKVVGAAVVHGTMGPDRHPLADATGHLSLHARNGILDWELPFLLAAANAGESLNPLSTRDFISFEAMDLVGTLSGDGRMVPDVFTLTSRSLGFVASGEIAVEDPWFMEGVLGVFFFPSLDSTLRRLPILNRVLLGRDESLVSAYFAVTGPWEEPEASLIPMRSLSTAPALVIEGVPAFVRAGLRRIRSVLPGGRGRAEDRADS